MESNSLKEKSLDLRDELKLSEGIHWLILINSETVEEIDRFISYTNSKNVVCEIIALYLSESENLKNWALNQESSQKFLLLSEKTKEKLGITSVPWFICIEGLEIKYSSQVFPKSYYSSSDPDSNIPEISISQSILIPPSSKFSDLIENQGEKNLKKALKNVRKFELKLKNNDKIIEDLKIEVKNLKLLIESNGTKKKIVTDVEQPTYNIKLKNLTWEKVEKKYSVQLDDIDFWKIKDNYELDLNLDSDDIDTLDNLWLAGMLRSSKNESCLPKPKILPPLQNPQKRFNEVKLKNGYTSNRSSSLTVRNSYLSKYDTSKKK